MKTGHTNRAGYNLARSATRKGVKVVSVVLGEPPRRRATPTPLRCCATASASTAAPRCCAGGGPRRGQVKHREEDTVELVAARDVRRVVRRGEKPIVRIRAEDVLGGAAAAGAWAGTAVVRVDGEVVARVPVITAQAVPEVGFFERAWRVVSRPEGRPVGADRPAGR